MRRKFAQVERAFGIGHARTMAGRAVLSIEFRTVLDLLGCEWALTLLGWSRRSKKSIRDHRKYKFLQRYSVVGLVIQASRSFISRLRTALSVAAKTRASYSHVYKGRRSFTTFPLFATRISAMVL